MIKHPFPVLLEHSLPLPARSEITMHVCSRDPYGSGSEHVTTRKFLAQCGTKFVVEITHKGMIKSIVPLDNCVPKCRYCQERIESIRTLIANELKQSR
jgi:hypothetical protein